MQKWLKKHLIKRHKQRLLEAKAAAAEYAARQQTDSGEQSAAMLEAALSSATEITPGMLPSHYAKPLELLRCIVTENYLSLMHRRLTLGENSIDWQVELLKLAEREAAHEKDIELPFTRAQICQAMNSYLDFLEQQEDQHFDHYAA